jgi:hypothetical protein
VARYAFPHTLFPQPHLVEQLYRAGSWTPFEKQYRAAAYEGYSHSESLDKEMNRFLIPRIEWLAQEQAVSSYRQFGKHSWIATADKAPFIPPLCSGAIKNSLQGPRSLIHAIGATFSCLRIVYVAEDLEIVLDDIRGREVLLFVVEENSCVTIVDKRDASSFHARTIVGFVGMNSSVSWQSEHSGQFIQHDQWYLEKKASLEMTQVLYESNESWIRKEYMLGEGAQLSYTFLGALTAHDQCSLVTVQEHRGSSSSSSVLVKTVGTDNSKSFYRGTIRIIPEALQSIAHQQQRALLLNGGARACAIPSLEVLTHEVQCTHGSAVGQFDEVALCYLQSKGLQADHAKRLIVEGFLTQELADEHSHIGKKLMKGLF